MILEGSLAPWFPKFVESVIGCAHWLDCAFAAREPGRVEIAERSIRQRAKIAITHHIDGNRRSALFAIGRELGKRPKNSRRVHGLRPPKNVSPTGLSLHSVRPSHS